MPPRQVLDVMKQIQLHIMTEDFKEAGSANSDLWDILINQ